MYKNDYVLADQMTSYLKDRDVSFDEEGFPILPSSCYSGREPESIVPWNHRNAAKDKENTALCFFMDDRLLYPRFNAIKEDAEKPGSYSSFISMDVSVSRNMPVEAQEFNMRLNALYSAILALKRDIEDLNALGIPYRIYPDFRTACREKRHG